MARPKRPGEPATYRLVGALGGVAKAQLEACFFYITEPAHSGPRGINYGTSDRQLKVLDRNLYVADANNHTIRKLVLETGSVTTLVGVSGQIGFKSGPLPAGLNLPDSVVVLASGQLVISDFAENIVMTAQ